MTTSTDVLVVGAGPTGLTLAIDLGRRSIDCRVVDRATTRHTRSRGKGLQPRSLEVFDDLGVAEAALAAGRTHHHARLYSRGRLALAHRGTYEARRQAKNSLTSHQGRLKP